MKRILCMLVTCLCLIISVTASAGISATTILEELDWTITEEEIFIFPVSSTSENVPRFSKHKR